jgi:hypothetical protein
MDYLTHIYFLFFSDFFNSPLGMASQPLTMSKVGSLPTCTRIILRIGRGVHLIRMAGEGRVKSLDNEDSHSGRLYTFLHRQFRRYEMNLNHRIALMMTGEELARRSD